jgi:hypothetical protein
MKTKPKVKTVTKAAKPRSAKARRSLERMARPPSVDMRSPLAKARDEWLASAEGLHCDDPSILRHREHAVFLTNRLVTAFRAGANWMEERTSERVTHHGRCT